MPKISLSGPAELLTIIPFHLGFQPERSVVVVCFHGKRLGLVARQDAVDHPVATESAPQLLPTVLDGKPSSVAVVGFEDEPDQSLPLLEELVEGLERAGVVVRERLVVRGGRWRSVGCDCCPDEGWLLPEQADVPAVASYVALGHSVLPDRACLARLVEPLDAGAPRHALTVAAIDDWQRRYADAGGSISGSVPGPEAARSRRSGWRRRPADAGLSVLDGGDLSARQFLVNDALVAWSGLLHGEIEGFGLEHWLPAVVGPLRDVEFRDAVVGWLCPGSVSLESFPDELVAMLEVFLGPDLHVRSSAVAGSASAPASPASAFSSGAGRGSMAEWMNDLDGDSEVRDDALAPSALDGGWDDWDDAAAPRLLLSRLEVVCRMTPAAHAAPLLSVVASLAWWCGDGARAGVAADRALDLEPDHCLSLLVRQSLDVGLRPPACA
ncbi:DUF4192 domain-containing protein [Terrabacter sp. 2RAF25]|uniref:DUF4192 domain-containing protein n=1 Tax=Terrabacter sp. 2RAF25 TaxID=3232998 RepID=UPI003F978629